jgi:hypothetical protein
MTDVSLPAKTPKQADLFPAHFITTDLSPLGLWVGLVGRCRGDCRRCRHCRRMLALNDSVVTFYDVIYVVLISNKRSLMTLRRDLGIVLYVGVPTSPLNPQPYSPLSHKTTTTQDTAHGDTADAAYPTEARRKPGPHSFLS